MSPQQHADKIDGLTIELNKAISAARDDSMCVNVTAELSPSYGEGTRPHLNFVRTECASWITPARVLRQTGMAETNGPSIRR